MSEDGPVAPLQGTRWNHEKITVHTHQSIQLERVQFAMNAQSINAASALTRVVLLGGAALYGASQSLFNVEGGHRAIVFNRLVGIKDTVACWEG